MGGTSEKISEKSSPATDADIQRIVEENEPGVGDFLAAYERVEEHYFAVVSGPRAIRTTTNTAAQ